jgi:HlyD family secretion protein
MNASVAFYSEGAAESTSAAPARSVVYVPSSALRGDTVFVALNGRAIKRTVKTGGVTSKGIRIDEGLNGGEDLIMNPPSELKDGDKIKVKAG